MVYTTLSAGMVYTNMSAVMMYANMSDGMVYTLVSDFRFHYLPRKIRTAQSLLHTKVTRIMIMRSQSHHHHHQSKPTMTTLCRLLDNNTNINENHFIYNCL
jgi:hypothetical protein